MNNQSPKTEEAYQNTANLLIKYLGDMEITELTFEHIRDWRLWLLERQKPDTARGNVICLRMVLKFLAERGYEVLRYDNIIVPKRDKRTINYLTEKEVKDFIKAAGRKQKGYAKQNRLRNVAIITLLFASGLRNSELCSLDRDTIRNRQFTIVGKSRDPRIIFINEQAEKAINDYLECRTDNEKALFISAQTGKRITRGTLRLVFTHICNNSRFENIHPHTIRHSYATHLLKRNVDLRYISDLMGHVDMNTTKIYTHYENPQLKKIYEKAMR